MQSRLSRIKHFTDSDEHLRQNSRSRQSIRLREESSKQSLKQPCYTANLEESHPRFGPSHAIKQDEVDALQEYAWKHVLNLSPDQDATREIYLTAMRNVEREAKAMYDVKATDIGSEFRWMMIVDGCLFNQIALHILGCSEQLGYHPNDPIFGRVVNNKDTKKWIEAMFLPGNQLPLVVLTMLMNQKFFQDVITKAKWDAPPLRSCKNVLFELLVKPSIKRTHMCSPMERLMLMGRHIEQPKPHASNLLDGFQNILLGQDDGDLTSQNGTDDDEFDLEDDQDEIGNPREALLLNHCTNHCHNATDYGKRVLPSATMLKKSGIHIKVLKRGGDRGIHYKNHYLWSTLYLPPLTLDHHTKIILRSLQNYDKGEVTLYLKIMSDLADTRKDANLLQKFGVISGKRRFVNRSPSMFRKLISDDDIILTPQIWILRSQIREHSNPWIYVKGVEFFALIGFIQTIFVAIQAIFAIFGYYNPPKEN